ncbi:MAG: hypothetical protein IJX13_00925, partial [Clostridia bacterium]|nr:hypothetical protein [Clostridia bacterium]
GTQKHPYTLNVESISLGDFCSQHGGVSFEDMAAVGEWYVNGEPATAETMIYDGAEVVFVTKMNAPDSGENPDVPDPTKGVTVWYNGQEYFVPETEITLYDFVSQHIGDFYQGMWYVNGMIADETTILSGECDLMLEIHGEQEHAHNWQGGYCPECDTYCDHNMGWDDGRCCVICGMPMGVELWEIWIIEDGSEVFYSQYGMPISLDEVLYSWYVRTYDDLSSEFVITVNGQECDGYYTIDSACKVELNRRQEEIPELEYYDVWVGRYYYYGSDDWNEMAWIDNLKTMWDSVPEGRSVYETLAWMGIDFDESDVVYLNDTLVKDLYNTYITERSYLTVLDAEIKVEPIYITVKDQTGDLGSQRYAFAAPVSVQWLLNVIFDGVDREAYDWHCSAIDYESVYINEMIAVSATIDVSYAEREVKVTDLESGKTETYYYEGAPMSVVEFAEEFLGITDFDAYYFYRDSGDSQPMEKDDLCDWRLVVLPKRMVPDKFVVTVEGKTE